MARPLRLDLAGGWYHTMSRGLERRKIARDERDRQHWVELLSRLPDRFGVRVHAYVLMDNHFHLLLETPEANLSQAIQWLNVSYAVWFNRRHRRSGPLYQGRFKAELIDEEGLLEVSRYIQLNPVRSERFGFGKVERRMKERGVMTVSSEERKAALEQLRGWKWSSYRAFGGYEPQPPWLTCRDLLGRFHGRPESQTPRLEYRRYVEEAIRLGLTDRDPWEEAIGGLFVGGKEFVERMKERLRGDRREQTGLRRMEARAEFGQIRSALEQLRGERWEDFAERRGDWGRDLALYLGREWGRYTLRELGRLAGGMEYSAVAMAVRRMGRRLIGEKDLRRHISEVAILCKVKT